MALPTFVAAGTEAPSAGDATPGLPAGWAAGDIHLLVTETISGDAVAAPTGYTEVADSPQTLAGTTKLNVFWRRAVGGDAAPTITDPGNHVMAQIFGFRGCITTGNPWDVTSGGTDSAVDSALVVPGDTTTVADCLVVVLASLGTDTNTDQLSLWANADLASVTERGDAFTNLGGGGGFGVATGEKATAGAYGNTTATLAADSGKAFITIALKPPAGASTQNLTGTLFTKSPTFFTGVVTPGAVALTGTLFTKAPTFFTGTLTATRALTGTLFTKAPTFFTGTVTAGVVTLTGTLFQKAPTFPTGAVSLAAGPQALTGTLFAKAPTFPTGTVVATYSLTGTLFQKAPTFPQGTVTAGAVTLTGTLFVKAPTFPQGVVTAGAVNLTGVLFQKAPTFPTGTVTAGTVTLTGSLFVKAPTFPTGTIGQAGTLFGNLFVKAPTFFTGSLAQGAPSFWQPDPAGWTANPAGFVRVGRFGPSPWGAELSGQRFEKAPTFPAGTVS